MRTKKGITLHIMLLCAFQCKGELVCTDYLGLCLRGGKLSVVKKMREGETRKSLGYYLVPHPYFEELK